MNIFGFFSDTETEVVNLIIQIKNGIAVVEADVAKAAKWIATQTPTIAADIQAVERGIIAFGASSNPNVAAAVKAANDAVAALDAFAADQNAGATTAQSIIDGYVAVKQAQAASASAAAVWVASK